MYDSRSSKSVWTLYALYFQCYFITIALILGTGILALPVTLARAGFLPFLLMFTINYFMQALLIISTLEILQYCRVFLFHSSQNHDAFDESCELLLLKDEGAKANEDVLFDICQPTKSSDLDEENFDEDEDEKTVNPLLNDSSHDQTVVPNLHMIGKMFLHKYLYIIYLTLVLVHFGSVLVSYSLAGSEAYGQIMEINYINIIPFFTYILAFVVITAQRIIRPVITTLTVVKGSLLFSTILVTMWAGAEVGNRIVNDWKYTLDPILMGTVALGGVPMVMPMLMEKFDSVREQMEGFRRSVLAALTTCYILNIFWCWSVLSVVPQSCSSPTQNDTAIVGKMLSTSITISPNNFCNVNWTLDAARKNGEISTVPLTKIIHKSLPHLQWIATSVQVFIIISVTVSFLTIGSAMFHTVTGWINDIISRQPNCKLTEAPCSCQEKNCFWHALVGMSFFSVVFAIAYSDPKSLIKVLEKVSSFGINCMSGPFMFLMVQSSRSKFPQHFRIPLPTHGALKNVHYISAAYFSFAVILDIVMSIKELVETIH